MLTLILWADTAICNAGTAGEAMMSKLKSKQHKETIGRVMHEFKHGELETGTGKKVEDPGQAIAIALGEAGASKYESDEDNEENLRRTKERERKGETAESRTEERK